MADTITLDNEIKLKAETPFIIIQALSEDEQQRLFVMLGVTKKRKATKHKPVFTRADAAEYFHAKHIRK